MGSGPQFPKPVLAAALLQVLAHHRTRWRRTCHGTYDAYKSRTASLQSAVTTRSVDSPALTGESAATSERLAAPSNPAFVDWLVVRPQVCLHRGGPDSDQTQCVLDVCRPNSVRWRHTHARRLPLKTAS